MTGVVGQLMDAAKVAAELSGGKTEVSIFVRENGLLIYASEQLADGNRVGWQHLVEWRDFMTGVDLDKEVRVAHRALWPEREGLRT